MRKFNYKFLFHLFFSLFLIALPFSKGVASTAYVGLLLLSIFSVFQKRWSTKRVERPPYQEDHASLKIVQNLLLLPGLLFLMLSGSLLYSVDITKGIEELISQSKIIGIPLIFYANLFLIHKRYYGYVNMLIRAVSIAVGITFVLFLLPDAVVQRITDLIGLKEYVIHEKRQAFGAYSPFIDRLQFSYLIVLAIFLELWSIFHLAIGQRLPYFLKNSTLILLLIGILLLGARGAQLGLLLGSSIWLIGVLYKYGYPRWKEKWGGSLAMLICVVGLLMSTILIPFAAYKMIPSVQVRYDQMVWELGTFEDGTYQNYDYTHFTSVRRLLSWKHTWAIIQEQPILGVGIGDYDKMMEIAYQNEPLQFPVNTHNQYLYYWASGGVLALGAFILMCLYWLYQCACAEKYWTTILSGAFFAFYFLVFLLDAPLNYQVGSMTFWLGYSIISVSLFERFSFKMPAP